MGVGNGNIRVYLDNRNCGRLFGCETGRMAVGSEVKWLKKLAKNFIAGKVDQFKDWRDPDRSETPQMPCPEMNIPMPQSLYAKLLVEAKAAGMELNGSSARLKGCTFDFNYDAEAEILHVTPDHLPWLFSCPEVESHIQGLIDKAKVSV